MLTEVDFKTLRGPDLREFFASANLALAKTTAITVLFESGLNMVCIKTEKPLGKRLEPSGRG